MIDCVINSELKSSNKTRNDGKPFPTKDETSFEIKRKFHLMCEIKVEEYRLHSNATLSNTMTLWEVPDQNRVSKECSELEKSHFRHISNSITSRKN